MEDNIKEMNEKNIGTKIKGLFSRKETPFTAESCFIQTKYGTGSYKPLEERIKDKQEDIKRIISSKFAPGTNMNSFNYSSYHAVVDIEEDLTNSIDEIFQPFIEGGFQVIDLSKECKSVADDTFVYLISWKNVFKSIKK